MSNDITPTIVITEGTLATQIAALLRYLLAACGAFALGRGWVDNETLQFITALVTVAAPMAYGVYKAYVHKTQLLTAEPYVPNNVMQVQP